MAKCKGCGTEIPEGKEYCEACYGKLNTAKDSESYLDSLLNAVMTEEPERREIVFPKREASSLVSVPETIEPVSVAAPVFKKPEVEAKVEAEDTPENEFAWDFAKPQEDTPLQNASTVEEAFDVFFDGNEELPDLGSYNIFDEIDELAVNRMLAEDLEEDVKNFTLNPGEDGDKAESEEESEVMPEESEFLPEEPASEEAIDGFEEALFAEFGELFGNDNGLSEDAPDTEEAVPLTDVGNIEDVFGLLEDARGDEAPEDIIMGEPEVISAAEFDFATDTFSGIVEEPVPVTEFNDFSDLFGETSEPQMEEVSSTEFGDFADLFSGFDGDGRELFEFGAEPEDFGASEEEPEETKQSVAVAKSEEAETPSGKKKAKKKKEKKAKGRAEALYHKLFDDVQLDPSKIKQPPTKEELEAKKKEKQEKKERAKEEKETLLAERKAQAKQIRLEKQRVAREAKAEKKAKKMEEAKLLLEEMERTRINRAGASIVFIFFAMLAVIIVVGTSIFSYSISIKNAEYEFMRDEYTLAYNEIYGLKIKEEDVMLYDRIMTVMYVQKQLNSYENYYGMNDMPRALDSLLKGLQRYEKYIELAVKLDVDTDLDSVRKKILEKVNTGFMLTEQEAMEIIQSENQTEYSKKVYDAAERAESGLLE